MDVENSVHYSNVNSEMFERTSFWLIFANLLPHEFKVLANKELL